MFGSVTFQTYKQMGINVQIIRDHSTRFIETNDDDKKKKKKVDEKWIADNWHMTPPYRYMEEVKYMKTIQI